MTMTFGSNPTYHRPQSPSPIYGFMSPWGICEKLNDSQSSAEKRQGQFIEQTCNTRSREASKTLKGPCMFVAARIRIYDPPPAPLHQGLPSIPEPGSSRFPTPTCRISQHILNLNMLIHPHPYTHRNTLHLCPLLPGGQARWHSAQAAGHPLRVSLDLKKFLRLSRAIRGCLQNSRPSPFPSAPECQWFRLFQLGHPLRGDERNSPSQWPLP